jgi:pimeloyl-ACP methyl ester carboxylesterase
VNRSPAAPPLEPAQRDTLVGGVRWRSRETPGAGMPILYVHGHLASSATWENVLVAASAGHPAIAVDLPGSGGSDRPWPYDYSVGGQARALAAFLAARGIGRAVLVGNSLGGATVMAVAAERPELVEALVLVAPATPQAPIAWPFRVLRAWPFGEIALALASRPMAAFGLRHFLYGDASRVTEHVVDDAWRPLAVPGTRRAAIRAIRTDPEDFVGLEDRIRVPTLIVWGSRDRLLPPAEAERLRARIPGSRVVLLPGAGHLPQREQPEALASAVSEFVARF